MTTLQIENFKTTQCERCGAKISRKSKNRLCRGCFNQTRRGLTVEELKNYVILAWCKSCDSQAKFTPAEPVTLSKEIWDFRAGSMGRMVVRRKPQRYECMNCGEPTIFQSLATLQTVKAHHARKLRRIREGLVASG